MFLLCSTSYTVTLIFLLQGKIGITPANTFFYFIMPAKQLKKIFGVFNVLCEKIQFRIHTDNRIRIVGHDKKKESVVEFSEFLSACDSVCRISSN